MAPHTTCSAPQTALVAAAAVVEVVVVANSEIGLDAVAVVALAANCCHSQYRRHSTTRYSTDFHRWHSQLVCLLISATATMS